jgi:endonuclease/exonuclease/phosphatase family metal-dependent hydrolase
MSRALSLVTLNTWKCDGDYPRRLELMRAGLQALRPDIVLLQEAFVTEGGEHDTAHTLASALQAELCFEPARFGERQFQGGCGNSWSGLAVLSRLPMRRATRLELPTHPEDGDRMAQLVEFDVDGERLLVINTHLTYLRPEDEVRCAQMANILRHPWLGEDYAAILLGGDLNDGPDGVLLEWLGLRKGWRVVDCDEFLNGRRPRHSTLRDHKAVKGSPLGDNYDYILLLEHLMPSRIDLLASDYVLDEPDPATGLYPSDHFGVRLRFRLREEQA